MLMAETYCTAAAGFETITIPETSQLTCSGAHPYILINTVIRLTMQCCNHTLIFVHKVQFTRNSYIYRKLQLHTEQLAEPLHA